MFSLFAVGTVPSFAAPDALDGVFRHTEQFGVLRGDKFPSEVGKFTLSDNFDLFPGQLGGGVVLSVHDLSGVASSVGSLFQVFSLRDSLEVGGINTGSVVAQVGDLPPFGWGTFVDFVGDTVGVVHDPFTVDTGPTHHAVAQGFVDEALPGPALGGLPLFSVTDETFSQGLLGLRHTGECSMASKGVK